jgi:hypothetical protein
MEDERAAERHDSPAKNVTSPASTPLMLSDPWIVESRAHGVTAPTESAL